MGSRSNGKGTEISRVNLEQECLGFVQSLLNIGFTPDEILDALSRAVQLLIKNGNRQ
jgi:hypothetical protein